MLQLNSLRGLLFARILKLDCKRAHVRNKMRHTIMNTIMMFKTYSFYYICLLKTPLFIFYKSTKEFQVAMLV